MHTSTRTITIGKCKVVIKNVPDDVTDEQLRSVALMEIYKLNIEKAKKEFDEKGVAS